MKRFAIVTLMLLAVNALAVDRTWVGSGGWNTAANWSPAVVPGSSDIAIFDGTSVADCAIDANASVAGILITNGYSGIITQNVGRTITIGTSHYKQYDGTFAGGNAGIALTGFTMAGGTFNAGSQTITMKPGTWTYSGGTFDAQTSTVYFYLFWGSATIVGSQSFYNLKLGKGDNSGDRTLTLSGGPTLTVDGTLTFDSTSTQRSMYITDGTIAAKGDIVLDDQIYVGSTLLLINGSGIQTFTGSAASTVSRILAIEINKTTGTLNLVGTIRTENNWTYTASGGTLNAGTSTIYFHTNYGPDNTITGSHTLYNVNIGHENNAQNRILTIASGTELTTSGTLTFDSTVDRDLTINTGKLCAQGNVTVNTRGCVGTAALQFTGTGNQIFTSSSGFELSGTVTINKPSGTVTLATNAAFNVAQQDLVWTAGGLNLSTHTLTVNDNVTIGSGAGTLTVAVTNATTFGRLVVGDDLDAGIDNAGLVVDFSGADDSVIGQEYVIVTNDVDLSSQSFASESFVGKYLADVTYGNAFVKLTNVRSAAHPGTIIILR